MRIAADEARIEQRLISGRIKLSFGLQYWTPMRGQICKPIDSHAVARLIQRCLSSPPVATAKLDGRFRFALVVSAHTPISLQHQVNDR